MKEKLKKEDVGFAQIKNEILSDKNLTWKAKGLFAYLYSKPDDWDFSLHRIVLDSIGGKREIMTGLQELELNGYLLRKRMPNGRMQYNLYYTQNRNEAKEPDCLNSNELKPQRAKTATVSNKELNTNIDLLKNKEDKTIKFIADLKSELKGLSFKKSEIDELKEFVAYWTEPNKSRTKLKWELEKTWDMERRVRRWFKNKKDWGKNTNNKYQISKMIYEIYKIHNVHKKHLDIYRGRS